VINIFPSIDTGTCAASVRKFNESAGKLENTAVCVFQEIYLCSKRFCGAEGLENVTYPTLIQEILVKLMVLKY
jgi:thiol peroxidase